MIVQNGINTLYIHIICRTMLDVIFLTEYNVFIISLIGICAVPTEFCEYELFWKRPDIRKIFMYCMTSLYIKLNSTSIQIT